jgi:hypothetical protein
MINLKIKKKKKKKKTDFNIFQFIIFSYKIKLISENEHLANPSINMN